MTLTHRYTTIDRLARPLHPTEAHVVAVATLKGVHVRACTCGWLIYANNDLDAFCTFKEHLAEVARVR